MIIAKNSVLHFAGSPIRNRGRLQMTGDWTLVDPATAKEYKIKAQVLEGQGKENGMIGINEQEMLRTANLFVFAGFVCAITSKTLGKAAIESHKHGQRIGLRVH